MWTLIIVVTIYSTLGLASILAETLRARGMNDDLAAIGFLTGMLLVALTVLTNGLKKRPGGAEIAVALGVTAVYFMVFFRMALLERSHLIEYSVVAIFIHESLTERANRGRKVPARGLLAIVATSLIGAIDECIQGFLPSRVFDPQDMLFNGLAAVMAVAASAALRWARRRIS
jgi:hypothetical protein